MLVLSRKPGEKILIGNDITFVVLKIRGKRVRVGIDAPAELPIARQELRTPLREASRSRDMHYAAGNP
jgi:carbon storage regulator